MTTTLTRGDHVVTPDLVLNYESSAESSNKFHLIIGGTLDVSLGNDLPRSGRLELFFLTFDDAEQARQLHSAPGVWTLADTDWPGLGMSYVRRGAMEHILEDETRNRWLLTIGYQEVVT